MVAVAATCANPTHGQAQVREEEEESGAGTMTKRKKKGSLDSLLGKRAAAADTLTADEKAEAEVTVYLEEMALDGEDPLT